MSDASRDGGSADDQGLSAKGREWIRIDTRKTVIVAAIGGFLFGYDTGVVSGALLYIPNDFHTTSFTEGLIVSILLLGAMAGALLAGRASDASGRKPTLIATAICFLVGIALCSLAPSLPILIVGRFILGLAVGAGSFLVPLYISELAPPEHRGALVSTNQLMVTVGIVVAYLVDYGFSHSESWRAMFAVGAIPAALLLLGMLTRPESPRWLVSKGREDEVRETMGPHVDDAWLDARIGAWQEEIHAESGGDWKALLAPGLRLALVVGIGLAAIQQFTGINTVIYYAPTILQDTGLGSSNAILNALPVGIINVVMTIVSMRLIDRVGRRPLLLVSLGGMAISLVVLGIAFLIDLGGAQSWVALVSLMTFVGSFAVGLGPVFWLLIAEIYPQEVRSEAASAATSTNWLSNFIVSLVFLPLIDLVGQTAVFWGLAVICVGSWIFVQRLVPETKGRSLEEIADDLDGSGGDGPRAAPAPA